MLALESLTKLEHLHIQSAKVSTDGLAVLANMPRLRKLEISLSSIPNSPEAPPLPKAMEDLTLSGVLVDAAALRNLENLRHLTLSHSLGVGDSAIAALMDNPKLESVTIHGAEGMTRAALASIKSWKKLTKLELAGAEERVPWLDDAGLAQLSRMTRLEELSIGFGTFTDRGLPHLQRLAQLRRLSLRSNPRITLSGLKALRSLPLEKLTVATCKEVDFWSLEKLFPGVEVSTR